MYGLTRNDRDLIAKCNLRVRQIERATDGAYDAVSMALNKLAEEAPDRIDVVADRLWEDVQRQGTLDAAIPETRHWIRLRWRMR